MSLEKAPDVEIPCQCKGRMARCNYCDGDGVRIVRGCRRCKGTGFDGGTRKCPDCRGLKWRDLDNTDLTI